MATLPGATPVNRDEKDQNTSGSPLPGATPVTQEEEQDTGSSPLPGATPVDQTQERQKQQADPRSAQQRVMQDTLEPFRAAQANAQKQDQFQQTIRDRFKGRGDLTQFSREVTQGVEGVDTQQMNVELAKQLDTTVDQPLQNLQGREEAATEAVRNTVRQEAPTQEEVAQTAQNMQKNDEQLTESEIRRDPTLSAVFGPQSEDEPNLLEMNQQLGEDLSEGSASLLYELPYNTITGQGTEDMEIIEEGLQPGSARAVAAAQEGVSQASGLLTDLAEAPLEGAERAGEALTGLDLESPDLDSKIQEEYRRNLEEGAARNREIARTLQRQEVREQGAPDDDRDFVDKLEDPEYVFEDLIAKNAPQLAVGTMATALGSLVGGPAGGITAGLASSFLQEGGAGISAAKEKLREEGREDLADNERFQNSLFLAQGGMAAPLETLGLEGVFRTNPLTKSIRRGMTRKFARNFTGQVLTAGGTESVTEMAQEVAANVTQRTFDQNRDLFANVGPAGIAGLGTGGGATVFTSTAREGIRAIKEGRGGLSVRPVPGGPGDGQITGVSERGVQVTPPTLNQIRSDENPQKQEAPDVSAEEVDTRPGEVSQQQMNLAPGQGAQQTGRARSQQELRQQQEQELQQEQRGEQRLFNEEGQEFDATSDIQGEALVYDSNDNLQTIVADGQNYNRGDTMVSQEEFPDDLAGGLTNDIVFDSTASSLNRGRERPLIMAEMEKGQPKQENVDKIEQKLEDISGFEWEVASVGTKRYFPARNENAAKFTNFQTVTRGQQQEQAQQEDEATSQREQDRENYDELQDMSREELQEELNSRYEELGDEWKDNVGGIIAALTEAEVNLTAPDESGRRARTSSFPEWIPDPVRSREYADIAISHIEEPTNIQYPTHGNANAQRQMVDATLNVAEERAGVDYSIIRGLILETYGETTSTSRSQEQVRRRTERDQAEPGADIAAAAEQFGQPTEREQQLTQEEEQRITRIAQTRLQKLQQKEELNAQDRHELDFLERNMGNPLALISPAPATPQQQVQQRNIPSPDFLPDVTPAAEDIGMSEVAVEQQQQASQFDAESSTRSINSRIAELENQEERTAQEELELEFLKNNADAPRAIFMPNAPIDEAVVTPVQRAPVQDVQEGDIQTAALQEPVVTEREAELQTRDDVRDAETSLLQHKLDNLRILIGQARRVVLEHQARPLARYTNNEGNFPDLGSDTVFGENGLEIVQQFGYETVQGAQMAVREYENIRDAVEQTNDQYREQIRMIRDELGIRGYVENNPVDSVLARQQELEQLKQQYDLSDAQIAEATDFPPRWLSDREYANLKKTLTQLAVEDKETARAKKEVMETIREKELEKVEAFRKAHNFPPISEMTPEQLDQYMQALKQFEDGSVFLTEKQIESVTEATDLDDVQTLQQALEEYERRHEELTGDDVDVEEMGNIAPGFLTRWEPDGNLAQENPFYRFVVLRTQIAVLEAEHAFRDIEQKANELAEKANASRDRGFVEGVTNFLVPQHQEIVNYLEADPENKQEMANAMTKEELDYAHYIEQYYGRFYEYLVKQGALKDSRFKNQYFTHVRRTFLEALKDDGPIQAVREWFSSQREDEVIPEIFDQNTGEAMSKSKFFRYTLQRQGELVPSRNVTRVFMAYAKMAERKKALDRVIPELDVYTDSLEHAAQYDNGLETKDKLRQFITDYLKTKGGKEKDFLGIEQNSKWALAIKMGTAFVSMHLIGFSPLAMIAVFGGEMVMTIQTAGPIGTLKGFKRRIWDVGLKRLGTDKGKSLIEQAEPFIGRNLWSVLADPDVPIGNRLLQGTFAVFSQASVEFNKIALLATRSEEEMRTGELDSDTLANLKVEAGRWRDLGKDMRSIFASTAPGRMVTQFTRWAIPIAFSEMQIGRKILSDLAQTARSENKIDGLAEAFTSKQARDLARSIGIVTAVVVVGSVVADIEDDDSYIGRLKQRFYRDALTILGGVNPNTFMKLPPLMSFVQEYFNNVTKILMVEQYQQDSRWGDEGELKGLKGLQRQFTPSAIRQFRGPVNEQEDDQDTGGGDNMFNTDGGGSDNMFEDGGGGGGDNMFAD